MALPQVLMTFKTGPYLRALAFDKEGSHLASISAGGLLQVWEVSTGKALFSQEGAAPKVGLQTQK